MRAVVLVLGSLLAVGALRLPPIDALSRRGMIAAAAATLLTPQRSVADQLQEGGALGSTCLGFGCNPYGRPDFNGAEEAPEGSLPYPEFLVRTAGGPRPPLQPRLPPPALSSSHRSTGCAEGQEGGGRRVHAAVWGRRVRAHRRQERANRQGLARRGVQLVELAHVGRAHPPE